MKITSTLSLLTVLGLCAIDRPALAQEGEGQQWYSDDALSTTFTIRTRTAPRVFRTRLRARILNESSVESYGPHRILVRSILPIYNAESYDIDAAAYVVNACDGAETCAIAPGESIDKHVDLPYLGRFAAFFLRYLPVQMEAQNLPYQLQLLHNADMDGTAGALQRVKPFSAIVDALRSDYPSNTLLLSSGDNYIPGPRFAAAADSSLDSLLGAAGEGRADIKFMNAMGYQASAVGNHDLDAGPAGFLSIIRPDGAYPGAAFPYLSSNLDFSPQEGFADAIGMDGESPAQMSGLVGQYTIAEVDGQRVGIVGATTPSLGSITNTGDIAISPADAADIDALAAEIQASVDAITAQGVNKIIVLAHMQTIEIEKALATKLSGVDIIVAGGSNTLLADANDTLIEGDTAADTYPLAFASATGEPTYVVNTDGDYKYLGRMLSSFDLSGRIIADRLDSQSNGVYASSAAVLAELGNPAPNPEVVAISDALSDILAARDGNIVGKASVYLDGRRGTVRSQESNLGNLTADANLWLAKSYDPSVSISLKNGGGIRDDIGYFAFPPGSTSESDLEFFPTAPNAAAGKSAGDISQFDVQGTLRFNNGLTLLTVSGTALAKILEHGIANANADTRSGRFPQVAGVAMVYSPDTGAEGDDGKLLSLVATDAQGEEITLVENGALTAAAASSTFRLVTLDYLYNNCGDGYPLPTCKNNQVPAEDGIDASPIFLETLAIPAGAPNRFTFADAGSEQDALAEYLGEFHSETPYAKAETAPEQDTRIRTN